ncbi:DAK2 domain-containing protein [Eubacterium ventriosum]|uniref:DAK2 domain-containing protein n=2 Tax=Eubacterium ventriosum TaxID=39496 RepID=A0A413RBW7_9FIRM|nr:DAK2 domain-containing protein [Eubacterium ventriosum]RHA20142.1 DAK2 domain-containing protein [Eubacterium ventriosum]RHB17930.1 DAK2 domain-containing protein [Eubacterium ventriosum]RHD17312.1 DAK2 domain-containing protein [Eubacterium ventriosum]
MEMTTINAETLQKMFIAGAKNLEAKKEWINELNVFPVPDGDTGTNMTLTIMSAAKEVGAITEPTMETIAKAISTGSLRGARGNSGVILSQLFRGFTREIKKVDQIDVDVLSRACVKAVETAYKAVMKPKEGTILTVAKGMADKSCELVGESDDLVHVIDEIIKHGDYVLSQTPEMLPVLKQAGVVDSGGQGLMTVIKGAFDALLGKEIDYTLEPVQTAGTKVTEEVPMDDVEIKFGYCTEFIINLDKEMPKSEEKAFKEFLESIGDSIVLVADDEIVKVHVHTNEPGVAITKALTYGSLSRMKIDNMREEHQERLIKNAEKMAEQQKADEPRKKYGFVAVSVGEGLDEIFKGLNVDYIISGGQTMNPSTEDILNAIDKINADNIYVLPNNKNIILAAQQAESLVEDKNIIVVPSKTIPQGISAMIGFIPDNSPEDNKEAMIDSMSYVKTGEVTYAVRDTVIDDKEIKEGNIMGIGDEGILAVGEEIDDTTINMIKEMQDEESEIVSLYYGAEVTEEAANKLADKIAEALPEIEVEVYPGGQPIYYYIASVE